LAKRMLQLAETHRTVASSPPVSIYLGGRDRRLELKPAPYDERILSSLNWTGESGRFSLESDESVEMLLAGGDCRSLEVERLPGVSIDITERKSSSGSKSSGRGRICWTWPTWPSTCASKSAGLLL